MDEIIFKDKNGKTKMTLKGDTFDIKDLEKDANILDEMIAIFSKNIYEKEKKEKEKKDENN
jgi:hypothetical protein